MSKINVNYEYIKYQMARKNMKCKDLAEVSDIELTELYNMLTKKSSPKLLTRLWNICEALDISLLDILEVEEEGGK